MSDDSKANTGAAGDSASDDANTTALAGEAGNGSGGNALDGTPNGDQTGNSGEAGEAGSQPTEPDYSAIKVPESLKGSPIIEAAKAAKVAPEALTAILEHAAAGQQTAAEAARIEEKAKIDAQAQAELAKLKADPQSAVLIDGARWALANAVPKPVADIIRSHPVLGNSLDMARFLAGVASQHLEGRFITGTPGGARDAGNPWDRAYPKS